MGKTYKDSHFKNSIKRQKQGKSIMNKDEKKYNKYKNKYYDYGGEK
jgi:hypothetical protein